jgi:hypothetical protein
LHDGNAGFAHRSHLLREEQHLDIGNSWAEPKLRSHFGRRLGSAWGVMMIGVMPMDISHPATDWMLIESILPAVSSPCLLRPL